jgi:hypothetical protein
MKLMTCMSKSWLIFETSCWRDLPKSRTRSGSNRRDDLKSLVIFSQTSYRNSGSPNSSALIASGFAKENSAVSVNSKSSCSMAELNFRS